MDNFHPYPLEQNGNRCHFVLLDRHCERHKPAHRILSNSLVLPIRIQKYVYYEIVHKVHNKKKMKKDKDRDIRTEYSLVSHVSTDFLIHLSAHLCHHCHSHHPSLIHSFTPGSKPTFSTNLPTLILLLPWTAFTITGPDRTYHASRFIFSSFFFLNFSVCSVWWTKLATRQLFTARQITVSYRIVFGRTPKCVISVLMLV